MSIDNLRPWEYGQMSADLYDSILLCQAAFKREMRFARHLAEQEDRHRAEMAALLQQTRKPARRGRGR